MTPDREQTLDPIHRVVVRVAFGKQRREITNYSVVLTMGHAGREVTVRGYDSAHGINDLHRHIETGGRQPAETFHHGSFREGMRAAIDACVTGYEDMIQAWHR